MAEAALEAGIKEGERGEELKTLSETIQPRCVALSTVHTIHRLISSTLKLEELLPRVARLCCQVLRAQSCVIWLMERDKKRLVPRAEVHVEKGKGTKRVARAHGVGEGVIGKTAQALKATFSSRDMVVPLVEEECLGVLRVARVGRQESFKLLDQEIVTTLAEQAVVAIRNAQMYETQERVTWGTIRSLSAMLEGVDAYTPGKPSIGKRLADIALAIADEMKVPALQQQCLQYAALLHDAGRTGVPEQILHKPSKLDDAEYARIKEHPVKGASFLEPLEILEPAVPIILAHHERYDGTGYPKGLKKEAIPLGARILGLANAVEAMISDRPYRRAMSLAEVAKEIASHAGTQFDPKVVEAFLQLVRCGKMRKLLNGCSGSEASL
jgi:HD-GYP domain-containing protein (c-di-GMP phosphodiesterase class II)